MKVFIAGHSLGAARAALHAYARVVRGLPVDGLYLFGCPNPGDARIGEAISRAVPLCQSIKNGRDLICDVPVDLKMFGEEYVEVKSFTETHEQPAPGDEWGPFRWHHSELYQAGCRKLPPTNAEVSLVQAIDEVVQLYNNAGAWEWLHNVDGQFCAMKQFSEAKLMIHRGSTTVLDWLNDFDAIQITGLGARVSRGFWIGIDPILPELDAALA